MGMFCRQGRYEEWDVHFSVAQRGHFYWKHIKAVIEVASKCSRVDVVFQITVCSRDESGVDWLGVRGTHGTDFTLLKDAEKFCLQLFGQFSNFIQEDRSSICGFNQPLLVCIRSRECASHMAEQFGFNQSGRQGGAIYGNKGSVLP